jgi:hypothetical protein
LVKAAGQILAKARRKIGKNLAVPGFCHIDAAFRAH